MEVVFKRRLEIPPVAPCSLSSFEINHSIHFLTRLILHSGATGEAGADDNCLRVTAGSHPG